MFLKNKLFTALYTILLIFHFNQSNAMTKKPDLTFKRHNFGVDCYNASDLEVVYANMKNTLCEGNIGRDRLPHDKNRIKATSGSFKVFSGPVEIKWFSKDGERHQIQLDLNDIFKGKKVIHKEKIEDLSVERSHGTPGIYIEVDDRTLNVYMDVRMRFASHILVDKNGNKRRGRRNVTSAFTKTF